MSEDLDANSKGQEPGSAEVGAVTDEANVESNPLADEAAKDSVPGDAEEDTGFRMSKLLTARCTSVVCQTSDVAHLQYGMVRYIR